MHGYDAILFTGVLVFYFPAFGLFHLMIFRVNRHLPTGDRIPHSLYWGGWKRLAREYRGFYPRSLVYQLSLICTVTCLIFAVGFAGFQIWEYATGR